MANPLAASWAFLRGDDLKVRTPAETATRGDDAQLKLVVFTTDSYDGALADSLYPTLSQALGGTRADWNSAAFACLKLLAQSFQEAPLRVARVTPDGDEWLPDHPVTRLLDDPHPALSGSELSWWVQWVKHVHGNAYLRKIRSRGRSVVQLWPISPLHLHPETDEADRARGVFISRYVFDDGQGHREIIPVEDLIHFRLGVDDGDHRLGLSPLRRLVRELSSDEEATKFTDALLKNFAVSSLVVTTPDRALTLEQAEAIKANVTSRFSGDARGRVGVLNNGATIQQLGFNPQQLDLKTAHQHPESRIAAVMGVPPMLVGFTVGLEHTTYNNMRQAQEHLFEQTVIPLWRADGATLTKQLLRPDFDASPDVVLKYDAGDVRALQEDVNEQFARLSLAVEKGWLTKDEARAEVGYDPMPDGLGEAQDPVALLAPPPGEDDDEPDETGRGAVERRLRAALGETKAQGLGAVPGLLDTLLDLTAPIVEADLRAFFEQQRERTVRAILEG